MYVGQRFLAGLSEIPPTFYILYVNNRMLNIFIDPRFSPNSMLIIFDAILEQRFLWPNFSELEYTVELVKTANIRLIFGMPTASE